MAFGLQEYFPGAESMKNVPDPDSGRPEIQESRGHARWVPPVIAIVILIVVLVILGVYYL
jgi:hypothetical protein